MCVPVVQNRDKGTRLRGTRRVVQPLSHLDTATRDLTLGADLMTLAHVGALLALLIVLFPFRVARLQKTLLR